VQRGLDRRLDRLWQPYRRRVAARNAQRDGHAWRTKFIEAVRMGLICAGIDPATVPAMRFFDESNASVYARRSETTSEEEPKSPTEKMRGELLRILRRHREVPLDLNTATPLELFAVYCFIGDAPGVSYPAPETFELLRLQRESERPAASGQRPAAWKPPRFPALAGMTTRMRCCWQLGFDPSPDMLSSARTR
jgi:hypothetical protein